MNYTDKEYLEALKQLQEDISDIQSAEQTIYLSDFDKALSEVDSVIQDEIQKYEKDS